MVVAGAPNPVEAVVVFAPNTLDVVVAGVPKVNALDFDSVFEAAPKLKVLLEAVVVGEAAGAAPNVD